MRYEISEERIYEEEDRTSLSQLAGPVRGIATDAWPRLHGQPMQHLFTLDLQGLELDLPAARGARLLVVFVMAFHELDTGGGDAVSLRWVTQEALDRVPSSTPPEDYEEIGVLQESAFEELCPALDLRELEETDDANYFDSYLGGDPVWCDAKEPEDKPAGRFILQISNQIVPTTRTDSQLYLFEGGAYIQRHEEPEEDDVVVVPWSEAVAASRMFVRLDTDPEEGAVQKWGGVPRGISEDEWPEGMSHVLTFEPACWPEDGPEDAVAIAVFADLTQQDEVEGAYQLVPVLRGALDEVPEPPAGVPILPERRVEMRPFPPETSYFDLRLAAYEGPRLAWRWPSGYQGLQEGTRGFQLTGAWLPNVSTPGTAYFAASCDSGAVWQAQNQAPKGGAEEIVLIEGLPGTLYAEETGAAVVIGHRLSITQEASLTLDELERFAACVKNAIENFGLDLELIVPGDTSTDRDLEVAATLLLGHRVVQMNAGDEPLLVDRLRVLDALAAFVPIPASFWEMLHACAGDLEVSEEPAVFLAAYGPLCYGALHFGRPLDNEEDAIYTFARCQNMEQEPSAGGVDGVLLTSVDFMELQELNFGDAALEDNNSAVSEVKAPSYFLISCYD